MATPVQRLRYFDGEYLRSYDFSDEQAYHIAMRRLMNVKLHLHGIVYGLEIVEDQDSVPPNGPFFFSIAPGMAIDRTGREIVVPAPYSLSNVLNAPGLGAGGYEVWICYQESQTGLPSAGYLDCNVRNQNTRWEESFQVQLKSLQGKGVFTDCGGVRLGVIELKAGTLGLEIVRQSSQTQNVERAYVGIRAQRVIAPDQLHAQPDPFDITAVTTNVPATVLPGYFDIHPGVFVRGNEVVKKNLVVGDDFVLDAKKNKNLPGNIPGTGNLKVTSDLFLNGEFYGFINGDWYKLKDYIQTLMPSIVVGSATVTISPEVAANQSGTFVVPGGVTSPIVTNTPPQVALAISSITWQDNKTLQAQWGSNSTAISVGVTLGGISKSVSNPKLYDMTIGWSAAPVVNFNGQNNLPIKALAVTYTVIFMP